MYLRLLWITGNGYEFSMNIKCMHTHTHTTALCSCWYSHFTYSGIISPRPSILHIHHILHIFFFFFFKWHCAGIFSSHWKLIMYGIPGSVVTTIYFEKAYLSLLFYFYNSRSFVQMIRTIRSINLLRKIPASRSECFEFLLSTLSRSTSVSCRMMSTTIKPKILVTRGDIPSCAINFLQES